MAQLFLRVFFWICFVGLIDWGIGPHPTKSGILNLEYIYIYKLTIPRLLWGRMFSEEYVSISSAA